MYTVPIAVRVPLIAAARASLAWNSRRFVRPRSRAGLRTVTTRSGVMAPLRLLDAQSPLPGPPWTRTTYPALFRGLALRRGISRDELSGVIGRVWRRF